MSIPYFDWPDGNQTLLEVKMNGITIWNIGDAKPETVILEDAWITPGGTPTPPPPLERTIPVGQSRNIQFVFQKSTIASTGYSINWLLTNQYGDICTGSRER